MKEKTAKKRPPEIQNIELSQIRHDLLGFQIELEKTGDLTNFQRRALEAQNLHARAIVALGSSLDSVAYSHREILKLLPGYKPRKV